MAGKLPQKFEAFARIFPIFGWLPSYESEWLRADVIAGLTLWGILVPEAIAYAAMAGAPPEAGLYTLLGSLVVYAFLGTTRQAASAPTSGSSIMMAAVVSPFLVTDPRELAELLVLLVLVVGIILLLCGLMRLDRGEPGSEAFWIAQRTRRDDLSAMGSDRAIGQHQLGNLHRRSRCPGLAVRDRGTQAPCARTPLDHGRRNPGGFSVPTF
jgi:hypothetical protein